MHRRARNSNQFSISRTREGEGEREGGGDWEITRRANSLLEY